jgi:myo-inositol-1(or 4)-monophosphatase
VVAGYIYDPNRNELFSARAGHGVYLNGRRVNVRRIPSIATGFFGVGACHRVPPDSTLSSIRNLLAHGGMYLRNGSAALMLAYVSCGRMIGYYENHLMPWDCLAGLLLVREGGGRMNAYFDNDGYDRGNVVCAWTPDLDDVIDDVFDLSQPVRLIAGHGN